MTELPKGFQALEPYIIWAEPTEAGRNALRFKSDFSEVKAFYDAMIAHVEDALTYLNQFKLHELGQSQKNLLFMCLSLTEAAFAVENYQQSDPPYLFPIERFVPTHDGWKTLYHR